MNLNKFSSASYIILFTPIVLCGVMVLLLTNDVTRYPMIKLSRENSLFEMVTAALLLAGGVYGLSLASRARGRGERARVWGFFLVFSLGLLLVGMEELAWGQTLFGFETPETWAQMNQQQEMTLHNLPGPHGRSDILWTVFAVGGLVGIWLGRREPFERIAPAVILMPWFIVILCIGVLVVCKAPGPTDNRLLLLAGRMDEFTEMLISMVSCLYLWLCGRRLANAGPVR